MPDAAGAGRPGARSGSAARGDREVKRFTGETRRRGEKRGVKIRIGFLRVFLRVSAVKAFGGRSPPRFFLQFQAVLQRFGRPRKIGLRPENLLKVAALKQSATVPYTDILCLFPVP